MAPHVSVKRKNNFLLWQWLPKFHNSCTVYVDVVLQVVSCTVHSVVSCVNLFTFHSIILHYSPFSPPSPWFAGTQLAPLPLSAVLRGSCSATIWGWTLCSSSWPQRTPLPPHCCSLAATRCKHAGPKNREIVPFFVFDFRTPCESRNTFHFILRVSISKRLWHRLRHHFCNPIVFILHIQHLFITSSYAPYLLWF